MRTARRGGRPSPRPCARWRRAGRRSEARRRARRRTRPQARSRRHGAIGAAAGGKDAMRSQRGGDSDGTESEGGEPSGDRGPPRFEVRYSLREGERDRGSEIANIGRGSDRFLRSCTDLEVTEDCRQNREAPHSPLAMRPLAAAWAAEGVRPVRQPVRSHDRRGDQRRRRRISSVPPPPRAERAGAVVIRRSATALGVRRGRSRCRPGGQRRRYRRTHRAAQPGRRPGADDPR